MPKCIEKEREPKHGYPTSQSHAMLFVLCGLDAEAVCMVNSVDIFFLLKAVFVRCNSFFTMGI